MNHDNTTGTVDLFPKYVLRNDEVAFSDSSQYYANSYVRAWLNGTFFNGFTEDAKNAIMIQSFPSNGSTLNDKVKCPSLNEVGLTWYESYLLPEGTIYPIFGSVLMEVTNKLSIYTTTDGTAVTYWTRSRTVNGAAGVWSVRDDGLRSDALAYWAYLRVVACIRF